MEQKDIDLLLKIVPSIISILSLITTILLARKISFRKNIREKQLDAVIDLMETFNNTFIELNYFEEGEDPRVQVVQLIHLASPSFQKWNQKLFDTKKVFMEGFPHKLWKISNHRSNGFLPKHIRETMIQFSRMGNVASKEALNNPKPCLLLKRVTREDDPIVIFEMNHGPILSDYVRELQNVMSNVNSWLKKNGGTDLQFIQ